MEYTLTDTIHLDPKRILTLKDIACVARQGKKVYADETVLEKIRSGHEVIKYYINNNIPGIYGVTTGLGSQKEVSIPKDILADYNRSIIFDHATSVGKKVSSDVVRATIFFRIAALSKGGSGISVGTFNGLLQLLNSQVVPVLHEWGSVGQADLAPLAQIALVLIGDGTASYENELMHGKSALKKAKINSVELQPRDALALIGTNSYSSAVASLAIWDVQKYINWAETAASLTWIAFGANTSALRSDVLKQHSTEATMVGQRILNRLSGTEIVPRSIQDPLSFRCIPQIHGYLVKAIKGAKSTVLRQISQPLDNPFLNKDTNELISNGNFDGTDLALECDHLRNALYRVIVLLERRASKLLMNHFSGYPTGLSKRSGYAGLDVLHHTLLSLVGEATSLAQVTPVQFGAAAEGIEDYGSMAAQSAQSLERLVRIWQLSVAIELVIAIRALSFSTVKVKGVLNNFCETIEKLIVDKSTPSDMIFSIDKFLLDTDTSIFDFSL